MRPWLSGKTTTPIASSWHRSSRYGSALARGTPADRAEVNLATARAYREGRGAFPERAALNQLPGRFLTDFYVTVARWVAWASDVVESWPDDVTAAPFDDHAAEEGVRLAASVPVMLGARPR
jgi:hypothetical protein